MRNLAATINTSAAFAAFHATSKPSWQIPPLVDKHADVGTKAQGTVIGYETKPKTYKGKPVISEITGKPVMVYRIYVAVNNTAHVIEGSVVMMREIGDAVRAATNGARDIPLPGDIITQTMTGHGEYNGYKTAEWSWSVSAQAISVDDFAALLESDNPMADTDMRIMCDSYGSVREVEAPRGEYKDIAEAMATAYELSMPLAKATTAASIAAERQRCIDAHPASASSPDTTAADPAASPYAAKPVEYNTYDPTAIAPTADRAETFRPRDEWASVMYGD